MDKKERATDYSISSGNENGRAIIETLPVCEDESCSIKFAMAIELQKLGLSDNAISRQLNMKYQRR